VKKFDIPWEFQKLIIMDILGLKKHEVEEMNVIDYVYAFEYSYITYTGRRVDHALSQAFGEGKDPNEEELLDLQFKHPEIKEYIEANKQKPKHYSIIPPYTKKKVIQ